MQTYDNSYSQSQANLEARSRIEFNHELLTNYIFDDDNDWLFGEIARSIEDYFDWEIDGFVISALSVIPLTIFRTSVEIFVLNSDFPHTREITKEIIQDTYESLEKQFPLYLDDEDEKILQLTPYQEFYDEVVKSVGLIEYETSKFYYDTAKVIYSEYIDGEIPIHLFDIMIRDIGFEFIPLASTHLKSIPQYV